MKRTRPSAPVVPPVKYQYGVFDPASGRYVPLTKGRQWLIESFDAMSADDMRLILPFIMAIAGTRPDDEPITQQQRLPAKAEARGWSIVK
jgi:hypothetical protein